MAGCSRPAQSNIPAEYQGEFKDHYVELVEDLRNDFPFHAGMSVADVQEHMRLNKELNDRLRIEDHARIDAGTFQAPAFADRDRHLYVYMSETDLKNTLGTFAPGDGSFISFWVNGRHQFFVDMAVANDKVRNVYITPGNFTYMLPSFCFDGTGKHVGRFNVFENALAELEKKRD